MPIITALGILPSLAYFTGVAAIHLGLADRERPSLLAVIYGVVMIVVSFIVQLIVLSFSRLREHYADMHGAKAAGKGAMMRALAKFYSQSPDALEESLQTTGFKALFIYALVNAAANPPVGITPDEVRSLMKQPTSPIEEILSAHPPIPKRLNVLEKTRLFPTNPTPLSPPPPGPTFIKKWWVGDVSKKRDDLSALEGVGPKTLEKLRELGVVSVEHLAEFTVEELVEAGVEYERAVKILQQATQRVGGAKPMTLREIRQRQVKTFKTGVAEFDEKTPWRGVREAFIYEFAGEYGAGKSMFAHQLSVAALKEGFTGKVVYIDTEGTFNDRFVEAVAKRFGVDVEKVGDALYVYQPANVVQLEQIVKFELPRHIQEGCRLVVIDTITALYRAEFIGREHLAARQQRIHYLVDWLRRHARTFSLTTILTNQVMDIPEIFAAGAKRPAGGNVLAHAVNARFMMTRPNKQRPEGHMLPLDVPGMPPDVKIEYRLTDAGVE